MADKKNDEKQVKVEDNPETTQVEVRDGGLGTTDPGLANNAQEVESYSNMPRKDADKK